MRLILALLFVATLCPGCATSYHRVGLGGDGYSDIQLGRDEFEIAFKGNCCTTAEQVQQLALLRAADVTVKNGFKWFAIIARERRIRHNSRMRQETIVENDQQINDRTNWSETGLIVGTGYAVTVPPIRHIVFDRELRLRIQGFPEKMNGIYLFEAAVLQQSIRARYKIK